MKQPRLPTGSSDSLTYTCTCPASTSPSGGLVLLFYRYFASSPPLPPSALPQTQTSTPTSDLFTFHTTLTQTLQLGGKIRLSPEGFNITVGGTRSSIQTYISHCLSHWSFSGLSLSTLKLRDAFFKPSPGCACCFASHPAACSVRITSEITPMGVTNYVPKNWDSVTYLSPPEFHAKCHGRGGVVGKEGKGEEVEEGDEEVVLVDVRNHYESRIGYFVSPRTGEKALTPGIRRFAQWPLYVRRRLADSLVSTPISDQDENGECGKVGGGKTREKAVLTYCTGGIRCEKGARFLADTLSTTTTTSPISPFSHPSKTKIYTLHGGISAYLSWIDSEIALGHKTPSDSLFKGKNYVFDARGSIGLSPSASSSLPIPTPIPISTSTSPTPTPNSNIPPQPPPPSTTNRQTQHDQDDQEAQQAVSTCHTCHTPSSHLTKCSSKNCHLILVICSSCQKNPFSPPPRCCASCEAMDFAPPTVNALDASEKPKYVPRPMCECEKERERLLWGDEGFGKGLKTKAQVKRQREGRGNEEGQKSQGGKKGIKSVLGDMDRLAIDIQIKTID